ncbi:MAG TPA: hypothetical protein VMU57_01335, partial [Edaphobacter sp.]|uniref:hypothetical protein n=1 Tax=Edaphobacter sp. TaxID=1934404 RepID=UPI002C916F82
MSDAHGNFGARFAGARSLREMDLLERTEGRAEGFVQFDAFIGDLLTRLLQDGPMVQIAWSTSGPSQMEFVGLTGAQRTFMEECWSLDRQQERGAWFLEEQVSAAAELLNLPYHYRTHGRFAATL